MNPGKSGSSDGIESNVKKKSWYRCSLSRQTDGKSTLSSSERFWCDVKNTIWLSPVRVLSKLWTGERRAFDLLSAQQPEVELLYFPPLPTELQANTRSVTPHALLLAVFKLIWMLQVSKEELHPSLLTPGLFSWSCTVFRHNFCPATYMLSSAIFLWCVHNSKHPLHPNP